MSVELERNLLIKMRYFAPCLPEFSFQSLCFGYHFSTSSTLETIDITWKKKMDGEFNVVQFSGFSLWWHCWASTDDIFFYSMRTKKQLAKGAWEFWIECHSCGPFLSHFWASFHRSTVIIADSTVAEFREPNLSSHNELTKSQKVFVCNFLDEIKSVTMTYFVRNLFTIHEWFCFGHRLHIWPRIVGVHVPINGAFHVHFLH